MSSTILPGTTRSVVGGVHYARTYRKGAGVLLRGSTSGQVGVLPPAAITNYSLTLPTALGGGDKLLQVDSSGNITLVDASTTSPAGTGTELQYRNSSAFGAVAGSSWDGTMLALPRISATSTTSNQLTVAYDATHSITLNVSSAGVMTLAGYKPSGSNVAAGSAYIDVPVSTGNATPGSLIVRSTVAGSSGSTPQTLADTFSVSGSQIIISAAATANVTPLKLFGNTGGFYCLEGYASDGVTKKWGISVDGSATFGANSISASAGTINAKLSTNVGKYLCGGSVIIETTNSPLTLTLNTSGFTNVVFANGNIGIGTTTPGKKCEINSPTGDCLRLTYNDANGSATNYCDLLVSSAGILTVTPSGGVASFTGDVRPATDDTYYLGKNDDDTPFAWKGLILKDTTNGKYYRVEVVNGVLTATDLTD